MKTEVVMGTAFPNDADGDALRSLVQTGSDLSKSMDIDFAVAVPDQASGFSFALAARNLGFVTSVEQDTETGEWTCYCTRTMVPSYEHIVSMQRSLEEVGRPYNAVPDGWGTFGNAPE